MELTTHGFLDPSAFPDQKILRETICTLWMFRFRALWSVLEVADLQAPLTHPRGADAPPPFQKMPDHSLEGNGNLIPIP